MVRRMDPVSDFLNSPPLNLTRNTVSVNAIEYCKIGASCVIQFVFDSHRKETTMLFGVIECRVLIKYYFLLKNPSYKPMRTLLDTTATLQSLFQW